MRAYKQNCAIVVTTISAPNKALKLIAQKCHEEKIAFYVIEDLKSPSNFSLEDCDFYSTERQSRLTFCLAKNLPHNHYSRKNLGYLLAMEAGHEVIIETDDDNIPLDSFWRQGSLA